VKPRASRWGQRLDAFYGLALRLHPACFRDEWEAGMRQAFRDRWSEVEGRGSAPCARFALEIATDLFASLAREHSRAWKELEMKRIAIAVATLVVALVVVNNLVRGFHPDLLLLAVAPAGLALLAFARPAWPAIRYAAVILNAVVVAMFAASLVQGDAGIAIAAGHPWLAAWVFCAGGLSPALNLFALAAVRSKPQATLA
jgi:hypothetical protein